MKAHRWLSLAAAAAPTLAWAGPTGLNLIPTTDLVPLSSFILGLQNGNPSFASPSFLHMPMLTYQSQFGLSSWLEAGVDYFQPPDLGSYSGVFNAKALIHAEDDRTPNLAAGIYNLADNEWPTYYVTLSKTLNYDQEQEERFRAHHRRNRKLLGRRVHLGALSDHTGRVHVFAGTDLQMDETTVFQADWTEGHGNYASVGVACVMPDQRTVINPALLFSNDTHRFNGFQLNLSHQFNF